MTMKRLNLFLIYVSVLLCFLFTGCDKILPKSPADEDLLDGPVEGLTPAQLKQFIAGDIAFNDDIFTAETGLGPLFVATSCGSCHAGDGKGHPFSTLTRFGQTDSSGNKFLNQGGPQLQHRAIPGFKAEHIPANASFSKFMPPANTGLGYLELVADEDIIKMSDPNDLDADGISGIPNWKLLPKYILPPSHAISKNNKFICRFGKKASAFNLLHQTVNAYNQDMGITSSFEAFDTYSGKEHFPEVTNTTVHDAVFYLQTLKVPPRRNISNAEVIEGETIFLSIGCEKCHKQSLKTSVSDVEALSNKIFHPYTDLLLHDMGPGLDDKYTEGSATTAEWRTPPLWGLGLSKNSQGGAYFLLHDGRAKSIEEAIALHGGEAEKSAMKYKELSLSDQKKLIKFLESL